MNVVVLAVELHQLSIKIPTNTGKNGLHGIEMLFLEDIAPIFSYKYQMNIEGKYTMSSVA